MIEPGDLFYADVVGYCSHEDDPSKVDLQLKTRTGAIVWVRDGHIEEEL
jgi:hypothetical protein